MRSRAKAMQAAMLVSMAGGNLSGTKNTPVEPRPRSRAKVSRKVQDALNNLQRTQPHLSEDERMAIVRSRIEAGLV